MNFNIINDHEYNLFFYCEILYISYVLGDEIINLRHREKKSDYYFEAKEIFSKDI